jgi:hypothetical protein
MQHKVHKVPGGAFTPVLYLAYCALTTLPLAYTKYAFFEWSLILFDVGFDAVTALDFDAFEIGVRDVKGFSKGYVPWLPKYSARKMKDVVSENWLFRFGNMF